MSAITYCTADYLFHVEEQRAAHNLFLFRLLDWHFISAAQLVILLHLLEWLPVGV